jgi:hypothetical protein
LSKGETADPCRKNLEGCNAIPIFLGESSIS